jgi:hypothetical protein
MRNATGPRWTIGITALAVVILALVALAYLLFYWQWIGTP